MKWLENAATGGHPEAGRKLGDIYSNYGKAEKYKIKPNALTAEKWYQLAAAQGDKCSELYLGYLFDRYRDYYRRPSHIAAPGSGTYEKIWHDLITFRTFSDMILVPDNKKAECYYKTVAEKGFKQPLEYFLEHKR